MANMVFKIHLDRLYDVFYNMNVNASVQFLDVAVYELLMLFLTSTQNLCHNNQQNDLDSF